jgi:oleate hydratase
MKAHLIGGGLASLAAAASLIRDGGLLGTNIAIYEAGKTFGGAMSVSGAPSSGYVLPTGRLFEKEYRCAFELFSFIPAVSDPQISIRDEIFAFNERYGYYDKVRIIDREDNILKSGHFGLSIQDRLNLVKLLMTPELMLSGRQIKEFFSDNFFQTEFWILWTTLMGSLPQHSAMEMRRFMCRFLHILPELSTMSTILRTRYNQERCDREADRQLAPATS